MTHLGKCPKCEKSITNVRVEDVQGKFGSSGTVLNCLSYCCPYCNSILGVTIDPLAFKTDIINGVKKALGR